MFGQPATFEHVAQLLLAPAAARLGRIAQRVDQLGGLARHALLPDTHGLDLPLQLAEGIATFGFDLADGLLVAGEAFVDRLQQLAELVAGLLPGLVQLRFGALQEFLGRGGERLGGGVAELRVELLARLGELPHGERVGLVALLRAGLVLREGAGRAGAGLFRRGEADAEVGQILRKHRLGAVALVRPLPQAPQLLQRIVALALDRVAGLADQIGVGGARLGDGQVGRERRSATARDQPARD